MKVLLIPEEILHHTYEYTIREDIVMAMEEPVSYTHLDVYKRQGRSCPHLSGDSGRANDRDQGHWL